ncbi:MAG TPA: metallophosphoesterase [Synechococcales cyanobacterium M55_K2018_004]|nr:metallophosphoesterase [Synechococcales cyanobacterium M55_K2018_004]
MNLKRRHFLQLGGGFLAGLGVGAIAQPLQADQSSTQAPAARIYNPPRGDVRIVVISDLNSRYGSTDYEPEVDQAIALLPTWQPDLVLCGGDMVAGQQPSLTVTQIRAMWTAFDQHVAAPLRRMQLPYGFTLGNHDASGSRTPDGAFVFERDRTIAAEYWNNPRHSTRLAFVDRSGFPFYYTFQQKEVFYLVWDASTATIPREQLIWAERALASPTAQQAKLRIVIGHLPLYAIAVGRDEPGEYLNRADQIRALLERHRVHTYISGHHHAYYPGHVGALQTLHCGILGTGMRPLLNGDLRPTKTLTVVDINLTTADTTYTTYDMQTLAVLDPQQLPKLIVGPNGKVLRRDVEWEELTPEEQATEYIPSY